MAKKSKTVSRSEAVTKIRSTNGRIFGVTFAKRTTGETRHMQCRLGVTSRLKGGPPAYDAEEHNLIRIFSMADDDYRSVPVEGLLEVNVDGVTLKVRS